MKSARWIIAVAVLQLGVLVYMAAEREWVVRTGRTIFLRTAPVDPRDPMRGDYVRFGYEIGEVPRTQCRDAVLDWMKAADRSRRSQVDRRVYATVRLDATGLAELVSLSDRRPADGVVLAGRVVAVDGESVRVRFGVEARFMQQGKALAFQNEQVARPGLPLRMEVAVSGGGLAVIKGHRWEAVGLTIKRETARAAVAESGGRGGKNRGRETLRGLTVEWKNWGDRPVAVVVGAAGRSRLRLVSAGRGWNENLYRWVGEDWVQPPAAVQAGDIRVLKPGETVSEFVDFGAAEWFVVDQQKAGSRPVSLSGVETWGASMRIEYAPPTEVETAGLRGADGIARGRVRSAVFTP